MNQFPQGWDEECINSKNLQQLTVDGKNSIIHRMFNHFLQFTNQENKENFVISKKKFDEWKKIFENLNVSESFFRNIYKKLYKFPELHSLVSKGEICEMKDIRTWKDDMSEPVSLDTEHISTTREKSMNKRIQYLLNFDGYISFPYYKFYSSFYEIVKSNLSLIKDKSVKIPIKYINVLNSIENFNLYKIEIDELPPKEAGDLLSLRFPCNKFIEKMKNEISMANIYLLFEISKFIDMYEKKEYPTQLYINSSDNVNIVKSNLHRQISTLQVPKFYNKLLNMVIDRNASKSKQKKSSTPKNKTTGKRKLPSSGPPKPPNTKKANKSFVIDSSTSNSKTIKSSNTQKKRQLIDLT